MNTVTVRTGRFYSLLYTGAQIITTGSDRFWGASADSQRRTQVTARSSQEHSGRLARERRIAARRLYHREENRRHRPLSVGLRTPSSGAGAPSNVTATSPAATPRATASLDPLDDLEPLAALEADTLGGLRPEAGGELAVGEGDRTPPCPAVRLGDFAEREEEGEGLLPLGAGVGARVGAGTAPGGAGWPAGASSHSCSSALSCSDMPG
jgi:hypothetical protein